ncbi:neurofilament heavy polypeptide [Phoenix dactylifera]|uniref:Neurofilament heavy polypeptide n=1 Tax=Phoenix dactylifera TaxID=42345 RepID=A0A8B7BMY2_PHODC|nr:neurofilament heavy polypeptide [Phoenix dactylifera]
MQSFDHSKHKPMATGVKEVHLKETGNSAPSTPRRVLLSHGRQTTADCPNGDIPMAQEKPVPNYLKPTMSSCHDTLCTYPKSQQQHAEDSIAAAGARKRLISIKSMEKPALPSSLLNKTPKGRTSRTDLSPKAALSPKIVPEKASKARTIGKTLTRAKSLPQSMPKRREANGTPCTTTATKPEQEEKVPSMDVGVHGHAARHGSQSPKSNTEAKRCTSSEESDTGKPRAPPRKVSRKVCGNEGAPKKLKFQRGREQEGDGKEAVAKRLKFKKSERGVEAAGEGKAEQENVVLKRQEVKEKDPPPAYNDVIEETATKLATRRSKVQALVGAFESVISLQEPETQPSQQQEPAAAKVGRVGQPTKLKPAKEEVKIGKTDAERGQPARMKPEEEEVKVGEKGAGIGQPGEQQQQPEEEVKSEESGKESSKGSQSGPESQQKGEEESGGEESKGGELVSEGQRRETEAKESKGEEGDSVVEGDGSNVTKELTESLDKGGEESAKE